MTFGMAQGEIVVQTRGKGLVEVTREVEQWLARLRRRRCQVDHGDRRFQHVAAAFVG